MKPGELFETKCCNYLNQNFGSETTTFHKVGGMNSTKSDIAVIKQGKTDYYIEAKDTLAQSGQFVLIPDEEHEVFVFSPRNRSNPNEMTDMIIEFMNNSFYEFNNAGTAGKALNIDSSVFTSWIIDHYKQKNVKFVISYLNGYAIFPIRKYGEYFDISATYRIKKSGSSSPAKKDISSVIQKIKSKYSTVSFWQENSKLFVKMSEPLIEDKFELGKYTYYFSEQAENNFEIRRLSNTYNMNVIFSVRMKKSQDKQDLLEFVKDI